MDNREIALMRMRFQLHLKLYERQRDEIAELRRANEALQAAHDGLVESVRGLRERIQKA